ncbi:FH2 domain-containing protein 1 [Geodia barretti]|uniref:FH2 domain-containing protein 1 n=1 Tax=Geodia barretti TaxID=519541 RepID=A0AA35RMA6_GEOBA|nr:FH2 domain-containing protein 1 [Geodia barretti]
MRKVNWVKVPRSVATKPTALWHPSTKDDEKVEPRVSVDMETVEDLFSRAEVVKKAKGGGEEEVAARPKVISLLDQKASLNVNIFLRQFKRENGAIVALVQEGDSTQMDIDQLKALEKLLPDSDTVEMLKGFSGDSSKLGLAEDFFHKLIAVKQYPLRVTFMTLTLEFRDKMADLRPAIAVLQDAIQEVVLCEALREVFYITLLTGNIINGGGRAGDAYGFTVSSLNKLKDTRANKPRMSLIHYITQICEEQDPQLLKLMDHLPHLEGGAKLSQDYLTQQIKELATKIKDLEKKCKKAPDDMKSKVTAFVKDAHRGLDELSEGLKNIEKQVKEIADYFCEDPKKLKIEELFSELLAFVRTYEAAVEVRKEKRAKNKRAYFE